MKSMEISNEQCLPYKFLLKKHKTVFYNSLILLTLYKTNKQKLKIYNIITIKFSAISFKISCLRGDADARIIIELTS